MIHADETMHDVRLCQELFKRHLHCTEGTNFLFRCMVGLHENPFRTQGSKHAQKMTGRVPEAPAANRLIFDVRHEERVFPVHAMSAGIAGCGKKIARNQKSHHQGPFRDSL
ncbi:hypothetical protein SDC9_166473 [bioreactor metagenome]|uniref:Uncharacterized protein n=1 Tax=bioreactor metagenome TaxID=1076179 RepID=A0A645FX62_9ZZZZ